MIPRMRRVTTIAATSALLATLTACTDKGTPKPSPTPVSLSQATKTLATDGQKIAASFDLTPGAIDDKTGANAPEGCPTGTARRRFTVTVQSAASPDVREELAAVSALAESAVKKQGYKRTKDTESEDQRGNPTFRTSWRKASGAVTFSTSAWRQVDPELNVVRISGLTDCLG